MPLFNVIDRMFQNLVNSRDYRIVITEFIDSLIDKIDLTLPIHLIINPIVKV